MVSMSTENLIALLALLSTWVGSIVTMIMLFSSRISKLDISHRDDYAKLDAVHREEFNKLLRLIGDHKVEVAITYASREFVREMEERLVASMNRISEEISKTRDQFDMAKVKDVLIEVLRANRVGGGS